MKVIFSSLDKNKSLGGWQETAVYIEEALQESGVDFEVIRPPNPSKISECDIFYEGSYARQATKKSFDVVRARSPEATFISQTLNAHPNTYYNIYKAELDKYGLSDDRFDAEWARDFRKVLAQADVVFCHSEWVKKSMIKNQKPLQGIRVVPKGVDVDFWLPQWHSRGIFRAGFSGQLQVIKGLQYLFDAWAELQLKNAELWVAGPRPTYIVRGQREWSCGKIFNKFLGMSSIQDKGWYRNREDLKNFYNALDVLVVPSLEDGWCMTAVEAMSCGVPVIVTTTTGMSQIIEDGVNGFIISPASTEEIAEKLEWFVSHEEERIAMGKAARETALRYDIPTYKHRFIDALYSCHGIRSEYVVNSPEEWTRKQVSNFQDQFFLSAQRVNEFQEIIEVLKASVKPGDKVLDVGCLDGSVSMLLKKWSCDVVACDLPELAQKTRELRPELVVIDVDLNKSFPEGKYDVIFASGIVEHLYNDFFFLCNCCAALEPGGVFIVSGVGFDDWYPMHLRIYPERQFRTLLTMAGFTHVDLSHSTAQRLIAVAVKQG